MKLAKRERLFVTLAAVAIALFILLEFLYLDTGWQVVNLIPGMSDPLTLSIQVRALSDPNPTTDYKGEFAIDESDAGQVRDPNPRNE